MRIFFLNLFAVSAYSPTYSTQITKKNINSFTTKHHKFMYVIVLYSSGKIGFSADGAETTTNADDICTYA